MFRWGILSTAKIAREQVVPQMINAHNGIVSAVASRNEGRAREFADRFGIPNAFGSYEAMLESDMVDGVYIGLPTSQHVEWSLTAARAGKHVLCEKPIAIHASEIAALIEARNNHNVLISEAYMVFYHPQWHKVKALLAEGAIGPLRHVQGVFTYFNRDPNNMRNQVELGGGGLPDIGVYPTVTTRIVTESEPQRVQAVVELDPDFGTDRYASVKADFGSFEASFYVSTQMAARQQMIFHGEQGFIEVHAPFNAGLYGDHRITLHNQNHDQATVFRFPAIMQYTLEAEAFADAATGGKSAVFTLENSVLNQKMIDAIYRAGNHDKWEQV